MGQTAIEFINIEDQERMRDEILTLLGLTHVPKARYFTFGKLPTLQIHNFQFY